MAAQQTADRRLVGRPSPKFGKFCNDMLFIKKMMKNILFFLKKITYSRGNSLKRKD
jgi:hypothetical protein